MAICLGGHLIENHRRILDSGREYIGDRMLQLHYQLPPPIQQVERGVSSVWRC
jgi:hypothetical protein